MKTIKLELKLICPVDEPVWESPDEEDNPFPQGPEVLV
jgi:hypothetical protein